MPRQSPRNIRQTALDSTIGKWRSVKIATPQERCVCPNALHQSPITIHITLHPMNKSAIVADILEKLRAEFDSRHATSKQARATGNDAETKAEGKYDTRSTEENYLADGLAKQALAAMQAAAAFEKLPVRDFSPGDLIDVGAVIELEFPASHEWFFLAPAAGGVEVEHDGHIITVITPASPLGFQLIGKKTGDSTTAPATRIVAVH